MYPVFGEFLDYTRKLDFTEKPDYDKWRNTFKSLMEKKNYEFDYIYCWTVKYLLFAFFLPKRLISFFFV